MLRLFFRPNGPLHAGYADKIHFLQNSTGKMTRRRVLQTSFITTTRRLLNNTIASGSIFTCRLHRSPWGDRCGVLRENVCVCFNLSANHIPQARMSDHRFTVVEQAFSSTRTRPDNNAVSHPDASYEQWSAWSYSIQLDAVLLDTNDNEIGRLVVKDTIEPLEAVGQVP